MVSAVVGETIILESVIIIIIAIKPNIKEIIKIRKIILITADWTKATRTYWQDGQVLENPRDNPAQTQRQLVFYKNTGTCIARLVTLITTSVSCYIKFF